MYDITAEMSMGMNRWIKMIKDWVLNGNRCDKCVAMWEDHTSNENGEDWDCGCVIKGGDYDLKACRIPMLVRKLMKKRYDYFRNHEYDGIYEYMLEQEIKEKEYREVIEEVIDQFTISMSYADGEAYELDKGEVSNSLVGAVMRIGESKNVPSLNLLARWGELIKETILYIPNKIKPFVAK